MIYVVRNNFLSSQKIFTTLARYLASLLDMTPPSTNEKRATRSFFYVCGLRASSLEPVYQGITGVATGNDNV
ncbi:MAG: hypothetical protein US50_C0012G0004 [Candidatus Nomurabacteria bacterium GW2011_GWB1_37_5]|uniref:Uncharacterized protein n=1 Tax=Candidatus Nomurabacteria bacterium GW2011_GWB1_37_5 TaxID=1618742 RepID=A0A0G0JFK8_9BACT|nr:MAG: hypothetical protein US50_C0012G0004 [Candidatus Nomurabacteria bacterium GW2011_GWB1_37_5]